MSPFVSRTFWNRFLWPSYSFRQNVLSSFSLLTIRFTTFIFSRFLASFHFRQSQLLVPSFLTLPAHIRRDSGPDSTMGRAFLRLLDRSHNSASVPSSSSGVSSFCCCSNRHESIMYATGWWCELQPFSDTERVIHLRFIIQLR